MPEVNFSNVQGNILKGFNKPHMRLIFFNFSNLNASKKWLRLVADRIPNTQDLIMASKEFKEKRKKDKTYRPQETWLHISLSARGIKKLGKNLHLFNSDPFVKGMKKRADFLGDYGKNSPKNWIEPFKTIGVDGVLIIASDQIDDADAAVINAIVEATEMGITVAGIQKGTGITNEQGKNVEHFGFRDGVSQPLVKGIDTKVKENDDIFEANDFVLSGADDVWMNEGSFLVFRRLQQDVNGFWNFVRKTSKVVGLSPEQLASKFVGRWDSGAPLARYPNSDPKCPASSEENDFEFVMRENGQPDDPRGVKTPRFSHIRKVYPRDDGLSTPDKNEEESDKHRILRRGIPYGTQISDAANTDRGLLFMCYQKDISLQFEYIQRKFSNNPRFPRPDQGILHGHDPIIGLPKGVAGKGFANIFLPHKKNVLMQGLNQWVITTGGEYFFSPSISSLKNS
jgi:Dyp-type peroxidase family